MKNRLGIGIWVLLAYFLIFGGLLIVSIYGYFSSLSLIEIGLPAAKIDMIIGLLSFAGFAKTFWHIIKY